MKDMPPVNIWNDIERCWVMRLDILFEGSTITGIHHSDFKDVVNDIDKICNKLQQYKSEMECIYKIKSPKKRSILFTHIYLLKDERTNYYKIGRSINPKVREKTLQSECPTYKIIWISELTSPSVEKTLHKIFTNQRIRGEWFELSNDNIKFIKNFDYGS